MTSAEVRGEAWEEPEEFIFVSADLFRLDPRFAERLFIEAEGGCWIWLGGRQRSGRNKSRFYGRIRLPGKPKSIAPVYVHRYVYTLMKGTLDPSCEVHHTCTRSLCCNPNHLTQEEIIEHKRWHGFQQRRY